MHSKFILYWLSLYALFASTVVGKCSHTYDYTKQVCCDGEVHDICEEITKQQYYQCCGKKYISLDTNQICCNGKVTTIPEEILRVGGYPLCCGEQVYNYYADHCCGDVVIKGVWSYNAGCCRNNSYDYSTQICCYETGKVLCKPKANCPYSVYYSCCNDQLLGPNQECCAGEVINPSITLVTDPNGYSYNATAYCCYGEAGDIVQNPYKEACCGNGKVIPVDGPNGGCCGVAPFNYNTQICCGSTIYSRSLYAYEIGCCGERLYDYNSQVCCNGNVVCHPNPGSYYYSCCGNVTYDYNKELCCDNTLFDRTSPTLACCY